MNPSDFFLQSAVPLEKMFREGVFDKGIKYVPVLDGLQQPRYFQWWLSPFTKHKVCCCGPQPVTPACGAACLAYYVCFHKCTAAQV